MLHLYVSQACVVGSLVYEVIERKGWREEAGARPNIEVCLEIDSRVSFVSFQWIFNFMCFQVFILRIFMWLIVGVISGAWAWSTKSLSSWKHLANRFRQIDLGR